MARLVGLSEEWKGQVFKLTEPEATIGRVKGNTIQVVDPTVSSRHCVIRREGEDWILEDLGSTNGTRHNGEPTARAVLKEGDSVTFGGVQFRFQVATSEGWGEAPGAMATVTMPAAPAAPPAPAPPATPAAPATRRTSTSPLPAGNARTTVSGIDLSRQDEEGGTPPPSFESASPFAGKRRKRLNLWGVLLFVLLVCAIGVVTYLLLELFRR